MTRLLPSGIREYDCRKHLNPEYNCDTGMERVRITFEVASCRVLFHEPTKDQSLFPHEYCRTVQVRTAQYFAQLSVPKCTVLKILPVAGLLKRLLVSSQTPAYCGVCTLGNISATLHDESKCMKTLKDMNQNYQVFLLVIPKFC